MHALSFRYVGILPPVLLVALSGCGTSSPVSPIREQHTSSVATAVAVQRSLSEFLSAQGHTSQFEPPVPDYIGWIDTAPQAGCQATTFTLVDYAGEAAGWLIGQGGPNLGTKVTGTVSERALSNGTADVTVQLHTTNALTWAITFGGFLAGQTTAPLVRRRATRWQSAVSK